MWDERYDTSDYVFGTTPNSFLQENVGLLREGRLLCLADGEGRNSVFLAGLGFEVTAVDASEVGLEKAERLAEKAGVSVDYIKADLESFDLGEHRWDTIVSIFCHLPPAIRTGLHKKIAPSLVDGGVLLLEAYTPEQLRLGTGGPPKKEMMMTAELLKVELEGLDFSLLQELKRDVIEGTGHSGLGAVVQAICEKKPHGR